MEESYGQEDFDASPRKLRIEEGSPRKSVPAPGGLPVTLPLSVLRPKLESATARAPPKTTRTRDTVIHTTSRRGEQVRNVHHLQGPGADLSHFYKPEISTYDRGYLDEVAYAEGTKERNRKRQEERQKQLKEEEERARLEYMGRSGLLKDKEEERGEQKDPRERMLEFFDRQLATEKARVTAREEGKAMADYNAQLDKNICPCCGNTQSFAEWRGGTKRCPKESCGGAKYRPKQVWAEVQGSFLKRWHDFLKEQERHTQEDLKKYTPAFRVTTRKVFDKASGEMVDEPIPVRKWHEVEEAFFERLEEVVQRKVRHAPTTKSAVRI
jgi:hypothetical protein